MNFEQNEPSSRDSRSTENEELERIRWCMVQHPNTPAPVLEELSQLDVPLSMLERIAEHPRANSGLLSRLASHADAGVRAAVSENPNVSDEIILRLSQDECPDVRYRLAENPRLAQEILDFLSEDENPYVAHRARCTLQRVRVSVYMEGQFPQAPPDRQAI